MSFDDGLVLGFAMGKKKSVGGAPADTPDADYEKWLALPEPADNQAVFLVRAVTAGTACMFNTSMPYDYEQIVEGYSVDWGDGTVDVIPNWASTPSHTYTDVGDEALVGLSLAIAAYVAPKVALQQAFEIEINGCKSFEQLDGVVIDYGG